MTARILRALAIAILTLLTACGLSEPSPPPAPKPPPPIFSPPDTVTEMDSALLYIAQDRNQHFWFGSPTQGVYRFDGKMTLHYTTRQGLPDNRIREIRQDGNGNLFFNTAGGVSKFDGHSFSTLIPVESRNWDLKAGDVWLLGPPNQNGMYRYDGKVLYLLKLPEHEREKAFWGQNPRASYSPHSVYTHYLDRRGTLWVGTSDLGVMRYDGTGFAWMYEPHFTLTEEGGSFGIRSIFEDSQGTFWICNTRNRYRILPGDSLGNVRYQSEPGIFPFRSPKGKDRVYFFSMVEDAQHRLWLATYEEGVFCLDGDRVQHFPILFHKKPITVYSIFQDSQGVLWLGTHSHGVYRYFGTSFEPFRAKL